MTTQQYSTLSSRPTTHVLSVHRLQPRYSWPNSVCLLVGIPASCQQTAWYTALVTDGNSTAENGVNFEMKTGQCISIISIIK